MPKPRPIVDARRCDPAACGPGECRAAASCPMKILRQEEPGEPPYPIADCKACSTCAATCPLHAITMG